MAWCRLEDKRTDAAGRRSHPAQRSDRHPARRRPAGQHYSVRPHQAVLPHRALLRQACAPHCPRLAILVKGPPIYPYNVLPMFPVYTDGRQIVDLDERIPGRHGQSAADWFLLERAGSAVPYGLPGTLGHTHFAGGDAGGFMRRSHDLVRRLHRGHAWCRGVRD